MLCCYLVNVQISECLYVASKQIRLYLFFLFWYNIFNIDALWLNWSTSDKQKILYAVGVENSRSKKIKQIVHFFNELQWELPVQLALIYV